MRRRIPPCVQPVASGGGHIAARRRRPVLDAWISERRGRRTSGGTCRHRPRTGSPSCGAASGAEAPPPTRPRRPARSAARHTSRRRERGRDGEGAAPARGRSCGNLTPISMPAKPASRASERQVSSGVSPPSSGRSSLLQVIGFIPILTAIGERSRILSGAISPWKIRSVQPVDGMSDRRRAAGKPRKTLRRSWECAALEVRRCGRNGTSARFSPTLEIFVPRASNQEAGLFCSPHPRKAARSRRRGEHGRNWFHRSPGEWFCRRKAIPEER